MVGGVGSFWPLIRKTQFGAGSGAVLQPPHERIMTHIYTSGYKSFNVQGMQEACMRITPPPTEVAAFWEWSVAMFNPKELARGDSKHEYVVSHPGINCG